VIDTQTKRSRAVIHVTRQLPPAYDGIGDYLYNLWRAWPDRETHWHFAVQQGAAAASTAWPQVSIHEYQPNPFSLATTLDRIEADTLVLHYVGYAFHRKGVPAWLSKVLGQWCESHGGRLITMFHELYADSSPLHSPFWLKPIARSIIRSLLRVSDAWVVTCERNWDLLLNEFHAEPSAGAVIPIGSNIPLTGARKQTPVGSPLNVAVFGLPATRILALKRHRALLSGLNVNGLLGQIVVIGKRFTELDRKEFEFLMQAIGGRWREVADLTVEQISEEFCRCDLGLVPTDVGILTKSTVFSGFVANGVIPIVSNQDGYQASARISTGTFLNSDTDLNCDEILSRLRKPGEMDRMQKQLAELARDEFSWASIASAFNGIVGLDRQPMTETSNRAT